METVEIHTLLCQKDIFWFEKVYNLFQFYTNTDYNIIIHEDGSFTESCAAYINSKFKNVKIVTRSRSDEEIKGFLAKYPHCLHFRTSNHHTIFKLKLFDPFFYTQTNNILYLDSDILFCKKPDQIIKCFEEKQGFYLRDTWSSYCVPFRDEDNNKDVERFINAGLNYYPTKNHYSLDYIEKALEIMYQHGSRGATHPFLEQSCIAYMITKINQETSKPKFIQLQYPDYCVPTLNEFIPDHGLTALHLNSCPMVGHSKAKHFNYEMSKILNN